MPRKIVELDTAGAIQKLQALISLADQLAQKLSAAGNALNGGPASAFSNGNGNGAPANALAVGGGNAGVPAQLASQYAGQSTLNPYGPHIPAALRA